MLKAWKKSRMYRWDTFDSGLTFRFHSRYRVDKLSLSILELNLVVIIAMAQHNELGKSGEKDAVNFLRNKGYDILETNYVYDKAEVDIIAKSGEYLVVVEVKTRSTPDFGDPQDFLKPAQIKRLIKAVDYYINEKDIDLEVRFDIIAIIKNKLGKRIEHLEDAFYYFE
ncbi:putative endonuclease [Psychroflexus sediminis]|uniref:UPF0102 protein SAMN04488027_11440 n=2 Tax=Psychroflexus sediminis TaxID=470826 RepID=A0A1G7YUX8_9FLAO|nr:putative endonuclease [Psychroflexus sediminis]